MIVKKIALLILLFTSLAPMHAVRSDSATRAFFAVLVRVVAGVGLVGGGVNGAIFTALMHETKSS